MFNALSDVAGVQSHRLGALERVGWVLADWDAARTNRTVVEQRMVRVLDELGLTDLVCTIPGLSAVGAAAILADTGDLHRFTSARAVVKHAGLAPRPGNACQGRSPARRASPGLAAPDSVSPRGGPSGGPCGTTRSTPPATPT